MRSAALLAVLLVVGHSAPAIAYQCSRVPPEGPSLYWNNRSLSYAINRTGYPGVPAQDLYDAVRASFDTWQAVDCSDVQFSLLSITDDDVVGYNWRTPEDNENLVVWRNGDASQAVDGWRHERGSIAVTTTTFNSRSGELLDADIEFNGVYYQFSTCTPPAAGCSVAYDVQNTTTHEIGHVVGLDHTPLGQPGASEATMYPSAPRGETSKRDLAADDIAGLCFIYPQGAPFQQCFPPTPPAGSDPTFTQVGSDPDTGCLCRGTGGGGGRGSVALGVGLVVCIGIARRRCRCRSAR